MHINYYFKSISGALLLVLFSAGVMAQKPLVTAAKKAELDQLATQLESTYTTSLQKALSAAPQFNWPTRKVSKSGTVFSLQRLNRLGFPIYYKTYNNVIAASTTRTNTVQPGGTTGLNLSGASTLLNGKLAIWDGGSVYTGHQEFAGKTITLRNTAAAIDLHATHVAGTMIAKGLYAPAKGMAFNASTLQSYDFNNDVAEITTAAATGLLLSNHSYGTLAGWNYDEDEARWEWYGLPGDTEDYKFGFYDSESRSLDQVAVNAPYYLIVSASGNSRGYPGPADGANYWGYTSRTNPTLINKGPRPAGISSNTGYDVIPGFSNAKNVLTVGAVNQLPYGPTTRQEVVAAYFSAIGPTDDGRIKPDICGDGDAVLSTSSSSPTAYTTLSGTSMATPNVTGSLYLLQELYSQRNSNAFMRSATLKALVCHTAFDAGNIGPDYIFGWGVLDMQKAAQAITDRGTKSQINENTLTQGQTFTGAFTASGNGPFSVTIAWTDQQGTVSADGTINDRTPKLVNDLDVKVTDGTTTYNAWLLDPLNPSAAATRGNNIRDNIEQVYIENAVPGKRYTITVTHKGTLTTGSQPYSMVITGIGGAEYCTSAPASNADSRINNFTLSNINNTPAAGCTGYSNFTGLTAQLEKGRSYSVSITLGTCGANFDKRAKVFVDWNGDGTFNPVTELAVTTSNNINGTGTFTGQITVPPDVIPGNYSLMRVVLNETSDPNTITPCGTYSKGETQDYRVQFMQAARDAGALSVSNSAIGGGCAGNSRISVRLKNFGTSEINNIPVRVTITPANGGQVTTLTETYTGTLPQAAEDDFILNSTYTTVAGASYTVTAEVLLNNDPILANNTVTASVVIGSTPVPTNLSAVYCDDTQQYLLSGTGDGAVLWYATPTGGIPVAVGQTTFTKTAPANKTFYAALNDYSASVGPATKYAFSGGSYNQFGQIVTVTTKIPVIIQSARLYVGNSGRVTITASNANGEEVGRTVLNVTATRTTPAAGAQADDLADQGQVYNLNLLLPDPGSYRLSITYANNATLYRSNGGVSGYPFGNDIFAITRNNATLATNPSDTTAYRSFYYYFFDMKVASAGCASVARVPVVAASPVITQNGTTLVSNFTANNQWYLNGVLIPGATGQTYVPAQSGNYQLKNVLVTGCTAISPVYTYIKSDAATNTPTAIRLSAYPVPATTELNVSFIADAASDMTLSLVNTLGKTVYSNKASIRAGSYSTTFSVSNQPAGTYILRVLLGEKAYSAKVIIIK
ncbi:S8 family serine peptidase [Mucilaginibacter sp. PAMB04274]|uniref:S8 family serine peptidase n=1 Tax=Mucilaginibacter sp. PAMB04274 TaxID=3138568 RepID=UPI0031F63A72